MKYEIGDTIILLQTDEEGTIVEFLDDKMVMVDVKGVRFPVYTDQIDFPYFKMFTSGKQVEKKKMFVDEVRREKQPARIPTHEGVFLRFFPVYRKDEFDDMVVEKMKIFLVNQNAADYGFTYQVTFGGEKKFLLQNSLRAASDFYLHDIPFEEMGDNPRFSVEFTPVRQEKSKAPFTETVLKVKPKQLFQKIEEAKRNNEPAISYLLFKDWPDAAAPDDFLDLSSLAKSMSFDVSAAALHLPPPRSVIDLHIEKLTKNPGMFSVPEILQLQLSEFEKYFDLARAHKLPGMIVIHGIGEGKLKQEIHDRLKNRQGVKSFINRYHPLYGYGATEIEFIN
jgi:hypothetical protein